MTWLLENPLVIVVIGAAFTFGAVLGWINTGRKQLMIGAIVAALLTIGLLGLERWVETDREAVRRTLTQMARDVEKNRVDSMLAHVHPKASDVYARVENEFPRHRFDVCDIKHNLKIEINAADSPTSAILNFNVEVKGDFFDNRYPGQRAIVAVTMKLRKDSDEKWKVREFAYRPVQDAIFGRNR